MEKYNENWLELTADENRSRKITIEYIAYDERFDKVETEKTMLRLGWWGYGDKLDDVDVATTRYLKTHSPRDILLGKNRNVFVKKFYVDGEGYSIVELIVKRNLKIRDCALLDFGFYTMTYNVLVWEGDKPVEKYSVVHSLEGTKITKFLNNGEDSGSWSAEDKPLFIKNKE